MMQTALLATNGDRVVRRVQSRCEVHCRRPETLLAPQEIHQNTGEAGIVGTSSMGARSFTRAIVSLSLAQKLHGEFGTLIRGWNANAEHQAHHDLPVQEARCLRRAPDDAAS